MGSISFDPKLFFSQLDRLPFSLGEELVNSLFGLVEFHKADLIPSFSKGLSSVELQG